MAFVWRGVDIEQEHGAVAVKVLNPTIGDDRLVNRVFEREFKTLEHLQHENIVRLLDVGRDRETNARFLVFPWYEDDLGAALSETE
jgi:serine/threonine protein kinase